MSEVVGKKMKLRKAGKDWVAVDDQSFTVSDAKMMFHDFGQHTRSGDIFDFWMWQTSCTFEDAVLHMASLAGMPLPSDYAKASRKAVGAARPRDEDRPADPPPVASGKRQITKVYDYTDADGTLIYQVCRVEWMADGKKKKTFMQRRPAPDGLKGWVWGLGSGEFMQGFSGDWYAATEDRRNDPRWRDAAIISIPEGAAHTLYRLPELMEERAQGDDARTVFIVEGEKDSDTLAGWEILGITNSGGAKHWTADHAEMFRDLDVVILLDNDPAGRARGHLIGASLRNIARRTRVLDWRQQWPNCPEKGDVTDWKTHAGGSAEKLYAIVEKLPNWTPVRPESNFSAVPFSEIDRPAKEFEWLIKKVLTRGETSVWFGAPGCGKSFLLTSAALAVSVGGDWMGFKVRRGLVVYQAGEGGLGLKKRLRAWKKENGVKSDENIPFVLLPTPVNLYADEADVDRLIAEIKAWSAYYDIALELVVIDTFSAASPGADENLSKDVGPVLARCRRIAMETGAHVAVVHHTPKGGGSPRGWSGFTGNVENVIEVIRTEQTDAEVAGDRTINRDVREFVVRKQKDGEDGFGRKFVLKQVVLGRDVDDDLITSCVVQPLGNTQAAETNAGEVPAGYIDLPPNSRAVMRALDEAIKRHGRRPPAGINAPEGTLCVTVGDWQEVRRATMYAGPEADDPDGKKFRARIKKQIERTYTDGLFTNRHGLMGKDAEWVWRTDRKVHRIDPPPFSMNAPAQAMLLTPDEDPNDLADLLANADSRYGR